MCLNIYARWHSWLTVSRVPARRCFPVRAKALLRDLPAAVWSHYPLRIQYPEVKCGDRSREETKLTKDKDHWATDSQKNPDCISSPAPCPEMTWSLGTSLRTRLPEIIPTILAPSLCPLDAMVGWHWLIWCHSLWITWDPVGDWHQADIRPTPSPPAHPDMAVFWFCGLGIAPPEDSNVAPQDLLQHPED